MSKSLRFSIIVLILNIAVFVFAYYNYRESYHNLQEAKRTYQEITGTEFRKAPLTITAAPGYPAWLDWSKVPPRFDYVMVTADGWPYACETKPPVVDNWRSVDGCVHLIDQFGLTPADDWTKAIWQRPRITPVNFDSASHKSETS